MPQIEDALQQRHIGNLEAALKRLPLTDEYVLSAKYALQQWQYEREALLSEMKQATEQMDGPRLKGLLGDDGWTFADVEEIVTIAREKFEWYNKLKKDLRGMMGKKRIVAMRKFLSEWPFTHDDPDIAGADVLLAGLEAQVSRIPDTNEGTVLKQVFVGLGGAWKETDAPRVLELRATVERYDVLNQEGQIIIKKKQERGAKEFLAAWPFAESDPIVGDLRQFLIGCDRRRERLAAAVRASLERRSLKDLTNDLQALRDAGGDDPEAQKIKEEWEAMSKERDHVLREAVESGDIEVLEEALEGLEFSAPNVDHARERLRILYDQEEKRAQAKLDVWAAPEYSISNPSLMGDDAEIDPDREP